MTVDRSPYSGREVTDYLEGDYRLYAADGDEVGKIVEVNEDFIVVERGGGMLGFGEKQNLYVPREQIAREESTDWYLHIDADQIDTMDWTEPPTRSADIGETRDVGTTREGTRLTRYEEDLEAQKVARETGEVTVGKHVVEDTKTIEVPVRREEVTVERHPVTADASTGVSGEDAFSDERITVPVMEEDVEVRKVARPVEEVEVTKTASEDTRRVDETVRREELDVEDTSGRTSS